MKLLALHVKRYRSVSSASLKNCGDLNVLIGKNNAGKSNLLATIELLYSHLRGGTIAGSWRTPRPLDQFVDRDASHPIQIGAELALTEELNEGLRQRLTDDAPHLRNAIDQIRGERILSIVVVCALRSGRAHMFVEQVSVGPLQSGGHDLVASGLRLLRVPNEIGWELFQIRSSIDTLKNDLETLQSIRESRRELGFAVSRREDAPPRSYYLQQFFSGRRGSISPDLQVSVAEIVRTAPGVDEALSELAQLSEKTEQRIRSLEGQQTEQAMEAFAGETKVSPPYVLWLMKQYGDTGLLHLRESKLPIGRAEAEALLSLKIKRGGPERLATVQQTVRSLLGVEVDAFAGEGGRATEMGDSGAEMDIDEFLVEANGAGIREALRIILDLELKAPQLALIEEPEVHLHPGLERALESYLRLKSEEIQLFVTTHSTNFIDAVSFQHVYLVSRDSDKKTVCEEVDPGNAVFQIPAELGIRLSSVFMFDRLVFVEGPSDEAVLRALARTLGMDTVKANVGFVHMGGVRNFGHFAAEATLDVLTRRKIRSWFIVDRDEASENDIRRMVDRLGCAAELVALVKREIENYLLDAEAVASLIREKNPDANVVTDELRKELSDHAEGLKEQVKKLRVQREALAPVFLRTRHTEGTPEQRLDTAIQSLSQRREELAALQARISDEVEAAWPARALDLAPGALVLERTLAKYGLTYSKSSGDSAKLASFVPRSAISSEVASLLRKLLT